MLVDYDSLVDELSRGWSNCRVAAQPARGKALSTVWQGMLLLGEASLSGMGRGAALVDEEKTCRGQLKRAFRLLNNAQFDPWQVGKALFDRLTAGLNEARIAVDWTHVGDFMMLEATLGVAGRGMPFLRVSVQRREIKGRQSARELSIDYALAARRRPEQTWYTLVDRGLAAMEYVGPSPLYPWMHRVTRLKARMLLHWESVSAPLREGPVEEGAVVDIPVARLGRRKQVLCGAVLAHLGATCYLAGHPDDEGEVLNFYQKRGWLEAQKRDITTAFNGRVMRFLRAIRFERLWGLLGLALSIAYSTAPKELPQHQRLSRRYKDGRKDRRWLSLSRYIQQGGPCRAPIAPLIAQ